MGDCARRQGLLSQLKCMVNTMPDGCCPSCPSCPTCPIIEIYDPNPKPAIPLGAPVPISPLDPKIPVPHVASPTNPAGGCCIPIISPQAVPCIPLAGPCPEPEQPCVPCNAPQMMVAYRINCCPDSGNCGPINCGQRSDRSSGSRRNGLQDGSGRKDPDSCGTICCSMGGGDKQMQAEYQCYPAYFKMPPCDGCGLTPCTPAGISGPCSPSYNCCSSPLGPFVPAAAGMSMGTLCPDYPTNIPDLPSCVPPVPTIALPPCPPITVPAPSPVIPTPVPLPIPAPVYPSCPPFSNAINVKSCNLSCN